MQQKRFLIGLLCSTAVAFGGGLSPVSGQKAYQLKVPLGLDETAMFIPQDNPLTPEKVALGKQLYFDKRLP